MAEPQRTGGIGEVARPGTHAGGRSPRADLPIRIGVALREPLSWHDFVQIVQTAEETGYEALFVPEIGGARGGSSPQGTRDQPGERADPSIWGGREAFATLAALAPVTTSLRLGSGVVPITARRAQTAAMGAATVQELSGGRFVLGVGAGFERSIDTMRAYVAEIRGTQLTFDPGTFPPIWLGALGDRMLALAGEIADGALLNWCTPERVADARQIISDAAERAGRDPAAITLAVYVRACVEPDETAALEALRPQAAQYASLPHYRRQLDAMGLGAQADAATRGDVSDELVRALCLVGDPAGAASRLRAYREAGADLPVVYPVPALEPVSSLLGTVLALAPRPALEA